MEEAHKTFAVRLAEELVLEMRNSDSIKVTARSALSIASELRRLAPMEGLLVGATSKCDKLLEVNKVLAGALEASIGGSRTEIALQALKLAGDIK